MTTVLFTCVGQRVDIVEAFRAAGATTIAVDANPLAPALYHADCHILVPRIEDSGYVPSLRAAVDEHDVRLIVPLTDLDQVTLARARDELGALVLLPAAEIVERLEDKYLAHVLFNRMEMNHMRPNFLVLGIQPNEGMRLTFETKVPDSPQATRSAFII